MEKKSFGLPSYDKNRDVSLGEGGDRIAERSASSTGRENVVLPQGRERTSETGGQHYSKKPSTLRKKTPRGRKRENRASRESGSRASHLRPRGGAEDSSSKESRPGEPSK